MVMKLEQVVDYYYKSQRSNTQLVIYNIGLIELPGDWLIMKIGSLACREGGWYMILIC